MEVNWEQRVLDRVREALAEVPGVVTLALGGSRARGTATPESDIDVGLYYEPGTRPDFDRILAVAADLDDAGSPAGHGAYGEWGPWVNGGVWLTTGGFKTDFLLRDLTRVETVVRAAARGRFEIHYQVGHPHGFASTIYAGEVFHNRPLHDPVGRLAALRSLVDPYPDALAEAVIARYGWEARFSLDTAASAAARGDLVHVCGAAYRTVACLNQVVFARNRTYMVNEKGALEIAANLPVRPPAYRERVEAALSRLGPDPDRLRAVLADLQALVDDADA